MKPYLMVRKKDSTSLAMLTFVVFLFIIKMSYSEQSSMSAVPETMLRVICLLRLVTNCLNMTTITSVYFHFKGL